MVRYFDEEDATIVDKWLSFAVERSVKELDINLKVYTYSLQTLLNAKALTSLNLENVRIKDSDQPISLPSLKNLSLNTVQFDDVSPYTLISRCPSIQYLSFVSCSSFDLYLHTLNEKRSLTCLNLECMTVRDTNEHISLSSLKTLSLKSVKLNGLSLSRLLLGSPWIQNLTLNSCSFNCGGLSLRSTVLVTAKFLTSLHLECLRITNSNFASPSISLPSLKTMSLKNVCMGHRTVSALIEHWCPSLECLSFSDCSNYLGSTLSVLPISSSSIKSLEVINCNFGNVQALSVENLESFTLVSECPQLKTIELYDCGNLKYLNIHAQHLKDFRLRGCKECVKATVNTPNLLSFHFTGYLKSNVYTKSPNLSWAEIRILDKEQTFSGTWEHFSTLREYLEKFDGSKEMLLHVHDAEALIFPEYFRDTCSPPLPRLKNLKVFINLPQQARDSDLRDSLLWLLPSAENLSTEYNEHSGWYDYKEKVL